MVVPTPTVVAIPFDPDALLISATAVFEDDHVTDVVISCVDKFVNTPEALNCTDMPLATDGFDGDMSVIDVRVADEILNQVEPVFSG